MPNPEDEGRTEKATPKKRGEARGKGQVVKSQEVNYAVSLMAGLIGLTYFGASMTEELMVIMKKILIECAHPNITFDNLNAIFIWVLKEVGSILAPFLAIVFIAGILSNVLQVGWLVTWKPVTPDFSKIGFSIQNIMKLVSKESWVTLGKSLAKIFVIGFVTFSVVQGEMEKLPLLVDEEINDIFSYAVDVSKNIILSSFWVLIPIAVVDYIFVKYQYEQSLKMTKFEVKDEARQAEGDPQVKARIKSLQFEQARKRMMEAVPRADVVITNPTHLAIALEYNGESMAAPKVIAKGAGFIAERIKEIALKNDVPMIEDKPLAQALFKQVEVGMEIPSILYKAVAEILAYVYGLGRNKTKTLGI